MLPLTPRMPIQGGLDTRLPPPRAVSAVSTESTPAADLLEARDHIGDEVAMHD